jgi:hypothetical protein
MNKTDAHCSTPNYCLPMNQKQLDPKEEEEKKKDGWYEGEIQKT